MAQLKEGSIIKKATGDEVIATLNDLPDSNDIPTALSQLNQDENNRLVTDVEKNKLAGIEAGAQKNSITSVQGRTGAVTISKSDVGLGSVNNVAITAAQVTKINELNYTRAMTQAQYDALSTSEKDRTDVWYGTYK